MIILPGILAQQDVPSGGGTAPSVVSITPYDTGANGTSWSVPMPATVTAGDLLLLFAACDGGFNDNPATAAANWTRIATGSSGQAGFSIFVKTASGSEGGTTITVTIPTTEWMTTQCYRIQGWYGNETTGIAFSMTTATPASGTVAGTSITSGFGSVPTLWIGSIASANAATASSIFTGWSGATDSGEIAGTSGQLRTAWATSTAASMTTPTSTFSGSPNECGFCPVAVRGTV